MESSARQSFPIAANAPLFIAAKIVSSGTHQIRIDPCVWANVSKDISEIWITTRNNLPRGRVVTLTSYSPPLSLRMRMDEGAKVVDIKQALERKYQFPAKDFEIHGSTIRLDPFKDRYSVAKPLDDNHPVTINQYRLQVSCITCRQEKTGYYRDGVPRHFCLSRMKHYAKEPIPDPPRYPTPIPRDPITRNLPPPKPEPSGSWFCCCCCPDD